MNSEEALSAFFIGVWIACVICAVYILHIPSAWRHVGYIHYHGDQQRLYERTAYGRREWRYTLGEHNVYPSDNILYLATDIHGNPLH
jgi:hypothetical protein